MKYMGSKARIAPEILPIILDGRQPGQYYVEPFCGGCNSLQHVTGNRIGSDVSQYLIAMWKGLQQGISRPQIITKQMYDRARQDYRQGTNLFCTDFEIGWIGFMASFRGKFFGGYSGNASDGRDYISAAIGNIEKQIDLIQGVEFYTSGYEDLLIPEESIIYCDIPYQDTTSYSISTSFHHDRFWAWCTLQQTGSSSLC